MTHSPRIAPHSAAGLATRKINIGDTTITAEVASTEAAREQGLSGRASLAEGSGMLFIFESDDPAAIWMKDMKFPIDVVWMDAGGIVITVTPDIAPDTYPEAFYPSAPARYILELPAVSPPGTGLSKGRKSCYIFRARLVIAPALQPERKVRTLALGNRCRMVAGNPCHCF